MKQVAIVTIIDNQNIGTFLQAYSLAEVVKNHGGHKVEILNYRRNRTKLYPFVKRIWKDKSSNPFSAIASIFYRVITVNIARKKLHRFLETHVEVTKKCSTEGVYKKYGQYADIYIAGSDQIWNSSYNGGIDGVYYLDFVKNDAKKIAYAASIGLDGFSSTEAPKVKKLLDTFDFISVRESSSLDILHDLGVDKVQHVLDPTLLLDKKKWESIAREDSFIKTEPYLLIYSVETGNIKILENLARNIASIYALKIYVVTTDWFRGRINCDKIFYFSTPERFLSLFANADFVVVSSFHGTAFSVNMNKQFISVMPNRFNSRVHDFLSMCNLEERMVSDEGFNLGGLETIDYLIVNELIDSARKNSLKYLDKELSC